MKKNNDKMVRVTQSTSDKIEKLAIKYSNMLQRVVSKGEMVDILIEEKEIREKIKNK